MPLKKSKNISCLSAYLGYFNTDYGTNYIRNNGIMNPANGNNITNVFSGAGNAYPMFGTGNSLYAQLGVLYTSHKPNHKLPSLLPYIAYRHSNYQKLSSPVAVLDAGINLMLNDHKAKLTLNYQSRPVFKYESPSVITSKVNNSSAWVQYQLFF
ncbi:MAG: hypothetical protein EBX41_05565, partial [Chitinophagia bacterium]|nr:hypothetical protein [Chitinophagia bacterium]